MDLVWTPNAWEDYLYWQITDTKKLLRINELIKDTQRSPFRGIGKPEPLRFDLAGKWSRRIDDEHRLVYEVVEGKGKNKKELVILQCRYHYK